MSLEKRADRTATPTTPGTLGYVSRFGQELKTSEIQQRLECLQKSYRSRVERDGADRSGGQSSGPRGRTMTHGSRSNEAFPRHGASNLARNSGSQGPADGGPAYSNYMKSKFLQDQHPDSTAVVDQVNYKYLAPNFSLSDSQPQRIGLNAASAPGLEHPDPARTSLSPKDPASYYKLKAASICMSDD